MSDLWQEYSRGYPELIQAQIILKEYFTTLVCVVKRD